MPSVSTETPTLPAGQCRDQATDSGPEAIKSESGESWTMYHGDCCEVVAGLPDDSIDFGIHSPPFANLYIYSDSERDMGNSANSEEFFEHYRFLIRELHRVTVVGRLCAVHCKDLPMYVNRDGTTGLIDFPGEIIRAFRECGWAFHSRVTIWKCPVLERERTNNNGLLHKTVKRDRSQVRQGMADYIVVFRKPPVGTLMSDSPISSNGFAEYHGEEDPRTTECPHPSPYARISRRTISVSIDIEKMNESVQIWRRYAEPVWWDINQTNVLNHKAGTTPEDEKHICPLQLDVIERCVHLWSLPGDVVLSPFAGVGSEGYVSVKMERRFVGVELKESYFSVACKHLREAEAETKQEKMF